MTAIEFYHLTDTTLKKLAIAHDVKNLDKYYQLTDFLAFPQLKNMGDIEQTFMQIAFHGQNATMISNIIQFEKNFEKLDRLLCGFNPLQFLALYDAAASRDEKVANLIAAFKESGFHWNTEKSIKRPNAIITRYANMLLDAAEYLKGFSTKQEIVADLQSHNSCTKELVKYFRSKIRSGYSIALTCDFLKEFDEAFCNLPKPDIHIKDVLCAYLKLANGYYNTESREYECIAQMQALTDQINMSRIADGTKEITVYQLDRMIWLVCNGFVFLDTKRSSKQRYIDQIR